MAGIDARAARNDGRLGDWGHHLIPALFSLAPCHLSPPLLGLVFLGQTTSVGFR